MFTEQTKQGMIIRVRLTPNSSCCVVKGIFRDAEDCAFLKINVVSVPEKGKANQELIAYLAKKFGVAKSSLKIISGETDRYKKILVTDNTDKIMVQLEKWLEEENIHE